MANSKQKKVVFTILAMLGLIVTSIAQNDTIQDVKTNKVRLGIMVGKSFSSFIFKNSTGVVTKNLNWISGNSANINLSIPLGKKQLIRPEINVFQAGSSSEIQSNRIYWNLSYASLNICYLYSTIQNNHFTFSQGILVGGAYLFNANQTIGSKTISLKDTDAFKSSDLSGGIVLNGTFTVSERFFMSLEYRLTKGFSQIEKADATLGQATHNIGHFALIGFGLEF
jgi:hypothetical protein